MPSAIFNRRFAANYFSDAGIHRPVVLDHLRAERLSTARMLQGQWQFGMFGIDAVITVHTRVHRADRAVRGDAHSLLRAPIPGCTPRRSYSCRDCVQLRAAPAAIAARRALRTEPGACRSRRLVAGRQAGRLALLLKFFFAPLMINWCLDHVGESCANSVMQLIDGFQNGLTGRAAVRHLAVLGLRFSSSCSSTPCCSRSATSSKYPALGNRIRTVEPTFFGWFICLACYPPFNDFTGRFLRMAEQRLPAVRERHRALSPPTSSLLLSLAIYSVGIHGAGFQGQQSHQSRHRQRTVPTPSCRHPAYAAKNFAWWIGALPALVCRICRAAARRIAVIRCWRCSAGRRSTRCAPSPRSGTCCSGTTATRNTCSA